MPETEPSAQLERRLRVAAVGSLGIRARLGDALNAPFVELVGIVETDETLLRAWMRQVGRVPAYSTLDALLAADVRPDAVLVANPVAERPAAILSSSRSGAAVLSEVPFAATLPETDALVATTTTLLMPAFAYRFDVLLTRIQAEAAAGALGTVRQARLDWSFPVSQTHAWEHGGAPDSDPWQTLLRFAACHSADIARWWLGPAVTVSADLDLPVGALVRRGQLPQTQANLIVGHAGTHSTHHLARARSLQHGERYSLTGTNATLEAVLSTGEAAAVTDVPRLARQMPGGHAETLEGGSEEPDALGPAARAWRMLRHFADCALGRAEPTVTPADARAAQAIMEAAYVSSREEIKVTLSA